MYKYIYIALLTFIAIPMVASATYNDVSLTTDATISIGSQSLTVFGSTAAIESIEVGSDSFTVVMPAGSSFAIKSTERKVPTISGVTSTYIAQQCGSESYTLTIIVPSSGSTQTAVITPTNTTCSGASSPSSSSNTSNVSSGSSSVTPIVSVAPSTPPTPPRITATAPLSSLPAFTKTLSKGITKSDVLSLQKILNSNADTKIAVTGPGSPGNETNYFGAMTLIAVKKFQVKYNIAKPGDAGYGTVGPKTRAKLNELRR